MITKRFPLYRDFLNLCMLYMLIISFFMMLASDLQVPMMPLEYYGTGVIILFCYLMREHVRPLWMYVSLHFVIIGICLFLPLEGIGKLRLTIMAVVLFLLDLRNRINHNKSVRDLPAGLGALFIPILFFAGTRSEFGYTVSIYYMGVAFVVLVLIRKLIRNYYDLSKTGQLNDDMPVKEILRNNTIITALIIVSISGAMLFLSADHLVVSLNRMLLNALYTEPRVKNETMYINDNYMYPEREIWRLPLPLYKGLIGMLYNTLPGNGTSDSINGNGGGTGSGTSGSINGNGGGTGSGGYTEGNGGNYGNRYDSNIRENIEWGNDNAAGQLGTLQLKLNPIGWIKNKSFVITLFDCNKNEEKRIIIRSPYDLALPLKTGDYRIENICLYGSFDIPLKYNNPEFSVDQFRTTSINLDISDMMDSIPIKPAGYALWMFIGVILYCICRGLIFLLHALFGKRISHDKTVEWKNEVRQTICEETVKERKRGINLTTPYQKIRDLYRRGLEKYKRDGVNIRNTKTPEENRESIRSGKGVDLREATELYERIRYKEEQNATAKDVAAMKKSLKF